MDELRLEPCPFCGHEARADCYDEKMEFWTVRCGHCGATGPYLARMSRDMAVTAWKRRHSPKPEPLTLERLRGMDDERVWVQYKDIGMYALVSYLTDEEYSSDEEFEEVMLTNSLGGRSSYHDILLDGATVYATKPETEGD